MNFNFRNNVYLVVLIIGFSTLTTQYDIQEEYTEESEDLDIPNVDESEMDTESILSNVVSDVNKTLTSIYNTVTLANVTVENKTQTTNETRKLVKCKEITYEDVIADPLVEIINSSRLTKLLQADPEITSRDTEADCVLVLFYARACPFSAHAAPHFNALQRSYPNVRLVALDALKYHGINAHYGIVGVPTLKMFHNGRPVGKFNGTEYNIQSFSKFVHTITGQYPQGLLVTSKDFRGPLSSVVEKDTDYFLVLSWLFIIFCSIYYFMQSKWWKMIVEMVQNNWRESEAQHEHND